MDYHIVKISRNKKQYLDLLLLGDEQDIMVNDNGEWQVNFDLYTRRIS